MEVCHLGRRADHGARDAHAVTARVGPCARVAVTTVVLDVLVNAPQSWIAGGAGAHVVVVAQEGVDRARAYGCVRVDADARVVLCAGVAVVAGAPGPRAVEAQESRVRIASVVRAGVEVVAIGKG